jgi:hypothetical protein
MNLFKTFSYLNLFCLCIALQAKIDPQKPLKGFLLGLQQPHALLPSDVNPELHGETPSQLWSAKYMVEQLGCDSIKIGMSQQNLKRQGITVDKDTTLLDYAQMPLYKEIIDLPYKTIYFWAHGTIKPRYFKEQHAEILYKEFYDFTKYLLTQYNNSGKVFMIGNWEGDWLMGGKNTGPTENLSEDHIQKMISWLNIRAQAVQDAKRDTPHDNVAALFYVEANLVRKARINKVKRLVNSVLPHVKNVDYLSISSYDIQNISSWDSPHTADSLKNKLYKDLNYAAKFLAPSSIKGKRVGIGEIGYPIAHIMAKYKVDEAKAELIQCRLGLLSAQVNLEWGTPFWLWWGLHNNVPNKGKYYDAKYIGFGLINQHDGSKRPIWNEFHAYNRWAKKTLQSLGSDSASSKVFRSKAVAYLKNRVAQIEAQLAPQSEFETDF